nr:proline-rich receptor-like protein kinase PERK8 [Aegilops tauschii subsp. strangulata]
MPWCPVLHLDLPDWIWAAPRAPPPPHTVAASSRTALPEPPIVIVPSSSSSSSHVARTSTTGVRNTSPPSPPLCRARAPAPARGHHRPARLLLLWTPRPTLTVASPRTVASLPPPGSRTYLPLHVPGHAPTPPVRSCHGRALAAPCRRSPSAVQPCCCYTATPARGRPRGRAPAPITTSAPCRWTSTSRAPEPLVAVRVLAPSTTLQDASAGGPRCLPRRGRPPVAPGGLAPPHLVRASARLSARRPPAR